MESVRFRYSRDIDVTINDYHSKVEVLFERNNVIEMKIIFRGPDRYFHGIVFNYDMFSDDNYFVNYVKSTAKDGSAFIARVYIDGHFYAIRKKKHKSQIVFMKSGDLGFKNYQFGNDIVDAAIYTKNGISRDPELINDFFEKRKPFDEQKYLERLDPDERKEYLNGKRIEEVIEKIGKKNGLGKEEIENLSFYIECLKDNHEIKLKVLAETFDEEEITPKILSLLKKAERYSSKTYSHRVAPIQDKNYAVDKAYVYLDNGIDLDALHLKKKELYVYDLMIFFEYYYEQIKDYLNKGIERVKKTIDDVMDSFRDYLNQ